MLATLNVVEVQRRTGRTMGSIIARRVRLKKRGVAILDQRGSSFKLLVGKSVWTPAADELVRTLRPYLVARKLGVTTATAIRRRATLGMPPIGRHRVPKKPRVRPFLKRWTKHELLIALSMPPREAVKRLPGRSLSAIHAVRNMRKRRGVKFTAAKRGAPKGSKYKPRAGKSVA
jgi:hypothetical protein